jgi:hypothetical protein
MAEMRKTLAQHIAATFEVWLNAFVITFLSFLSAAAVALICNHIGLINLTAFDPRAWDAALTVASGSGALVASELVENFLLLHRKRRLLASWR